ncbi:MAG TPA: methylenetetrahydrofolate reductase [NAD(P)H], partial [Gammaproteobacteria bacterium]|nr:methylenetetrahydrofolate reductase [NAD(P)H] [Gammaproteobacteria bacterium]
RLAAYGDDKESLQAFGIEVVSDLCNQLLSAGCPGLHFYSMNQALIVEQVCNNLHLPHKST